MNARRPLIGRVLGARYQIDALLGEGGFGVVYRASHLRLGDSVAIKVISNPKPDHVKRFHREAQLQRRLRHPVTVRLLDFDIEEDGLQYMVQEYVDGTTIESELANGPLEPPRVVALAIQVLGALEEAHEMGIIHRDLKPENIMVTDGLRGEEARLLDFGVAKLRRQGGEAITQQNQVIGTVSYMAPEQILQETLTPATDLYQLGVVVYELLSCARPFNGTMKQILRQHLQDEPRPLPATVPERLSQIVLRAMSKQPEDRFASARDMRLALLATELAPSETGVELRARSGADALLEETLISNSPQPHDPLDLSATRMAIPTRLTREPTSDVARNAPRPDARAIILLGTTILLLALLLYVVSI